MKTTAVVLGMAALLVCLPMVAAAGDYHSGTELKCSQCHVMHYSQQHPDDAGDDVPLAGGAKNQLLRQAGNDLCLSCHENNVVAPDVLFTNTGKTPSDVRQAGALNRAGFGTATDGHTLDYSGTTPGGGWSTTGLSCADCHDPHGIHPDGNSYRNLVVRPGTAGANVLVSYAVGTNDPATTDVFVRTVRSYDISEVDFNEPGGTGSAYADFCKGCHEQFHGAPGGPELGGTGGVDWIRHPTNGVDIGAVGDGTHSDYTRFSSLANRVKVMSQSGNWPNPDNTPSCMSCHKAHGNQNAFGLIYMSGTGVSITEEGDDGTETRDLCRQCHIQG